MNSRPGKRIAVYVDVPLLIEADVLAKFFCSACPISTRPVHFKGVGLHFDMRDLYMTPLSIDAIELYERNMIEELALRLVPGELPVGS